MEDFVNDNEPNVSMPIERKHYTLAELGEIEKQFQLKFEFDDVDDAAFPVVVFKLTGDYVAWYDIENCVGYISV